MLLILDLWGISFHAVGLFGLGKKLLLKSILGRCEDLSSKFVDFLEKFNFKRRIDRDLLFVSINPSQNI